MQTTKEYYKITIKFRNLTELEIGKVKWMYAEHGFYIIKNDSNTTTRFPIDVIQSVYEEKFYDTEES